MNARRTVARMRWGLPLVVLLAAACADGAPSEAEANRLVDAMLSDALLKAPPGSKVVTTVEDPCGDGSVAPGVARTFSGGPGLTGLDLYYQPQLKEQGWTGSRRPEAGGLSASKGPVSAYIGTAVSGEWTVSLQHGEKVAACR